MQGFNVTVVAALLAVSVVTIAQSAGAQTNATRDTPNGYRYDFDDDPMSAGALGPNDARVRVMLHPLRQTLTRPRVSFVPQMLESIEKL